MVEYMELPVHDRNVIEVAELSMKAGLTLSFEYDGKPRTVEVHALGISPTGNPVIRAFQVDGGSISGETPAWKLFSVSKIKELPKILDIKGSYPREGYQPGDRAMAYIFNEFDIKDM